MSNNIDKSNKLNTLNNFHKDPYIEKHYINPENIIKHREKISHNFFKRNFRKYEKGSMRFLIQNWLTIMSTIY